MLFRVGQHFACSSRSAFERVGRHFAISSRSAFGRRDLENFRRFHFADTDQSLSRPSARPKTKACPSEANTGLPVERRRRHERPFDDLRARPHASLLPVERANDGSDGRTQAAAAQVARPIAKACPSEANTGLSVERPRERRRVRLKRTNLRVKGLSLNRSQKRTALLSTTPRLRTRSSTNDLASLRRIWLVSLRHTDATICVREEPSCCGFATAGAEIGRPAYIVASRHRDANGIVAFLDGILT